MADAQFVTDQRATVGATHKVLRNTYLLLSMTLIFSATMAGLAMAMNAPYMGFFPLLISIGLIFAISRMKNSAWGILLVFAFTGILGFSLGPMLNYYMQSAAGTQTVVMASGLTGVIFLSLSGYTLISQKDFSFMSGFLMTGMWVIIAAMLAMFLGSLFGFYVSGLHLAISSAVVILMSGFILYDTSRILHGGETNYIMATVSLYLDIYNLFVSLLMILGIFGGDD
ncbi:MAG TPA: Bax inhibitor-1/YccA family protein [Gammaproteobacteria bacterium]|nr:Bax inhibitor-1/YccA family protein [Gammaproteobacteria bacterium]HIL96170.1 Bax inhibitor-1/YccA family protein [Pseudomonadales bacterium]